jgi:hypothetical protein
MHEWKKKTFAVSVQLIVSQQSMLAKFALREDDILLIPHTHSLSFLMVLGFELRTFPLLSRHSYLPLEPPLQF